MRKTDQSKKKQKYSSKQRKPKGKQQHRWPQLQSLRHPQQLRKRGGAKSVNPVLCLLERERGRKNLLCPNISTIPVSARQTLSPPSALLLSHPELKSLSSELFGYVPTPLQLPAPRVKRLEGGVEKTAGPVSR